MAHSDRLALPMMIAPAAFSLCAMNASSGVLSASAQEPAVVGHARGVDVVLDDDGNPEQRSVVAVASRPSAARASAKAVGRRDHRVERRVELVDAPEIEVRQLDD